MSVSDSTFPNKNMDAVFQKASVTSVLSLNQVFKESIKKAEAQADDLQMIVRCQNLPQIKGNYSEIVQLFDMLLAMILNNPPQHSKLYLYVDCEEDNVDMIDSHFEGAKQYLVKFYTNITTHDHWKVLNSQSLINCKQILSNLHGNLVVNNISSTGCLFTISLPGKFELDASY